MVKKVLKFGGTSVGSVERIQHVANIIRKERENGNQIIAVVSAMSGKTNELIRLAKIKNEKRFIILKIQDIKIDFKSRMIKIFNSFGYNISHDFNIILNEENKKNKNYRSKHNYKLDNFNINSKELKNRFEFVYDYFN